MAEVTEIHIGVSSGPLRTVDEVDAVAGKGLEGDRYFSDNGHEDPGRQITLLEYEAVEAAVRDYELDVKPIDIRRQLVTRGVALNHLVGRTFTVGEVTLRGVELCEPCGHMERLSGIKGVRRALIHRGGLNAEIVSGGKIRVGDPIET